MPWTVWLNQQFIPHSSGGWEVPRSRHGQIPSLTRTNFLVCKRSSSYCISPGREGSALWCSFLQGHHLHVQGHQPHDLITFQMPRLQVPSHWELGFHIWIQRGHKHTFQSTRHLFFISLILCHWITFKTQHLLWIIQSRIILFQLTPAGRQFSTVCLCIAASLQGHLPANSLQNWRDPLSPSQRVYLFKFQNRDNIYLGAKDGKVNQ